MTKPNGGDKIARRKFARAMARAVFGRFYMAEQDLAELREAAERRPKPGRKD